MRKQVMEHSNLLPGRHKKQVSQPRTQQKHPLRWLILLWLGFMYLQQVQIHLTDLLQLQNLPPLTKPVDTVTAAAGSISFALIAFTILMVAHSILHCIVLFSNTPVRRALLLLYFLLQGICVLQIFLLLQMDSTLFGLCLALMIEVVTLLPSRPLAIAGISGYLLLYISTQSIVLLQSMRSGFNTFAIPKIVGALISNWTILFFVIACFILYIQQTRARQHDQELLRELEGTHSQLKQTHDQLETAHIQLEDYAARVEDLTLSTERQRMARELHDTLAQGLVGLTMQLETIDALLARQRSEQARTIVQQAMTRARTTITSARAAITNLRAETLAANDLATSIEDEIERFTTATAIPCEYSACTALPHTYHKHLLRIVSEGLTNIARHAQATQAWIRVWTERERIIVEVRDNGVGFDPAQVASGHYGLLGLRERARLMHGEMLVVSTPAQGTTLRLHIPHTTEEAQDE